MMGSNLPALVQDSIDNPERYDEDTQLFLSELATGARKLEGLSPADKAHLDQAVVDYASFRPRRQPPAPVQPKAFARPRSRPVADPYEPSLQDGRAPQVETAGGVTTPYWWVT